MWDLPGPGIEPMSPALPGRFFTTEPLGKPDDVFLRTKVSFLKRSPAYQLFFFMDCGVVSYLKSHCHSQDNLKFFLCYLLGVL